MKSSPQAWNCPEFVRTYWRCNADGELLAGGVPISSLARRHGTPFFVYDSDILEKKYSGLRHALPERFSISYSVKANPQPAFLNFFVEKGLGLEVASAGELQLALTAKCKTESIFFAGPGKTESELEFAIERRIGEIHAESRLEIERISAIGKRLGAVVPVALRINPTEDGQGGAMRMGGKPAPFGVDEEAMDEILRRILSDAHIEFRGIHLFVGTQILDCELLLAQYRKGLQIAKRAAEVSHQPVATVDLGGGFGIPYFAGDSELDLPRLGEGLSKLMAEIGSEACFSKTTFLVEPGRFLVGESGIYVARINDIKISRGKKFLILDGGMNHHLAASGNLGQVIKRNFPVAILNRLFAETTETVDIVGPLCTPLDTLGRSVQVASAEVGDLIGIFQSGAYARTASPLGFLSHPSPPEIWMEDGRDLLIRERGSFADPLRDVLAVAPGIEIGTAGRA